MPTNEYSYPDVEFVETDTETIVQELVASYEDHFGRTLHPADPVRQLILWFASILSQERSYLNLAAKRNLPRYAEGGYLDSVAEIFYDITREQAAPAMVTLRFTLSEVQDESMTIPEGTEATADGSLHFATIEELTIPAGEMTGTVEAECTQAGQAGNGYAAGTIRTMIDQLWFIAGVENTTESVGGADTESDEDLYGRLRASYEGYSTAGTVGAYGYHAMQHNSAITDYDVQTTQAGEVLFTMLTDKGMPTAEEITDMQEYLSSDEIRPVTDKVTVAAPTAVPFTVKLTYYGDAQPNPGGDELSDLVHAAAEDYVEWQTSKLGRRINPGKLTALLITAGAGRIVIDSPKEQELKATECAVLQGELSLTYGGEDE